MSAPFKTLAHVAGDSTPIASMPRVTAFDGHPRAPAAPMVLSKRMLERATREMHHVAADRD